MMHDRRQIVYTALLGLLAACSGGNSNPPGDNLPAVTIPPPNPLDVTVTLDEARTASQPFSLEGGSMSVTAEDGVVYTLTIPEDALLEATDIIMTPIHGIEGPPVTGGRLLGVELKPHGLRLYDFATLTINPPGGGSAQAIAFSAQEGGKEFHLYPLELTTDRISMKLIHFSEYGAYIRGENDPILIEDPKVDPDITIKIMPTDWEAQLEQMLADLMRKEREAQLRGEEGDPQFAEKLAAILDAFYEVAVEPMLGRIASDCTYAEVNGSKVLGWSRNVSVLGFDESLEEFAAKTGAVMDAVREGADNCWQQTIAPCINQNNEVQVSEAKRYAQLNRMLGGDPATYDPDRPDLQCDTGCAWVNGIRNWTARTTYQYQKAGSDESHSVEVFFEGDVTFQASMPVSVDGGYRFGGYGAEGTMVTDSTSTSHGPDIDVTSTTYGSGPPTQASMAMTLDTTACTYNVSVRLTHPTVTSIYPSGSQQPTSTAVLWEVFGIPFNPEPGVTSLTADLPVIDMGRDNMEATNRLSIGAGGISTLHGVLEGELGTGAVTWSIAPAETP